MRLHLFYGGAVVSISVLDDDNLYVSWYVDFLEYVEENQEWGYHSKLWFELRDIALAECGGEYLGDGTLVFEHDSDATAFLLRWAR
jgi:hypothetical protein